MRCTVFLVDVCEKTQRKDTIFFNYQQGCFVN